MITCDVMCTGLVLVMVIPGLPPAALIGLLFTVTLMVEPFLAARQATNMAALGPDRFQLGNGITISTYQAAQLIGFAAGGIVAATAGARTALLIDAASFAGSAVIVRAGVHARPAADPAARYTRPQIWAGVRIVFTHPLTRTAMLLMWLRRVHRRPRRGGRAAVPPAGRRHRRGRVAPRRDGCRGDHRPPGL